MPRRERARLAILTGEVRAGKTTAALRVTELARGAGHLCGGFLSPDDEGADGQKRGIDVVRLTDGARRRLALVEGDLGGPRVGPYSFDQASIDWAIAAFLDDVARGRELVAVDELGRLEVERGEGFAPLLPVLAEGSYRRALAVVRLGLHEQLAFDPSRVEVAVFQVAPTAESRARTPEDAHRWLFG